MIGRPEWFTYRILGWGIRPKTKEGWMYVGVAMLVILGISLMPMTLQARMLAITAAVALLLADTLHIMTRLSRHHDERENMHQLIIERNCSFAAIVGLIMAAVYEQFTAGAVSVSVIMVLVVMLATKIASTAYVRWRL